MAAEAAETHALTCTDVDLAARADSAADRAAFDAKFRNATIAENAEGAEALGVVRVAGAAGVLLATIAVGG